MKDFVKHFQSLEAGKLYLITEVPGMGLEAFLLLLTAVMSEDQSVTWVDYKYRRAPIKSYYRNLNVQIDSGENEKIKMLSEKLMLDFYMAKEKELIFVDQEPFYAPYCFDQLIQKFRTSPTKFMIINNFNSFFGEKELYDPEERNWVMRQFKQLAVKCNCILLLSYSFEDFDFQLYQLPPKLKEYNWSRNMVMETDEIYFFLRYDYFTAKHEKDLAEIFSIKQNAKCSVEVKNFSPVELLKRMID